MNFIKLLANARIAALQDKYQMDEETATNKVNAEVAMLTNANPSTTGDASNAGDAIPSVITLASIVDTAPDGRWSFVNALSAGRQPLQSLNNEYPILGDVEAAGEGSEWTSGGFYDNKEATEGFDVGKITISPKSIYASYGISRELAMYSMIDLVNLAMKRLAESTMLNIATSILNGDSANTTTNINCFGTAPSTAFARGLKDARATRDNGLRKVAYAGAAGVTKINVGTPNGADDIFDAMKLISFGGTPSDYVMIMDNKTYWTYMKSDDFKDAAKNGQDSTIFKGAITNISGVDLFVTDLMPLTNANGVVSHTTPAGNTQGSIIICKRNCIQHGFFGNVKYGMKEDLEKGYLVEAISDFGFSNISTRMGRNEAVLLYNIDVA